MNRRKSLKTLATASVAAVVKPVEAAANPIQLHVDLEVAPGREKDLQAAFAKVFRPTISKQKGFVEVKLLKFRNAVVGAGPSKSFYRLLISFQSEELRQTWVASADHQRVWPEMEKNLTGAKFAAWLYDIVIV